MLLQIHRSDILLLLVVEEEGAIGGAGKVSLLGSKALCSNIVTLPFTYEKGEGVFLSS